MKTIKQINIRFSLMCPLAFLLLRICLFCIMTSVFMLYIFIDTCTELQAARLSFEVKYILDCVIYAVILSFGGAFLLDIASAK